MPTASNLTDHLQQCTDHHNRTLGRSGDLPVHLALSGEHVTLRTTLAEEAFILHGEVLRGRGGSFDVLDPWQCVQALMTVQPTAPVSQPDVLGLSALAGPRGLEVRRGRATRWAYDLLVTPIHVQGPAGQVLWLAEYASDGFDGPTSLSLFAGHDCLAAHVNPLDLETTLVMAMSDEEMLAEFGELVAVPDQGVPSLARLQPEALTALLAGAALTPEHLIPADFFDHPERYEAPALAITRAALRAQRRPSVVRAQDERW